MLPFALGPRFGIYKASVELMLQQWETKDGPTLAIDRFLRKATRQAIADLLGDGETDAASSLLDSVSHMRLIEGSPLSAHADAQAELADIRISIPATAVPPQTPDALATR